MQKVLVAQPGLGLTTNLALHAFFPFLRHEATALWEMLAKILRQVAALREDNWLSALARRRDDDDRGFAQGMHLLELWGCERGFLVAVVHLDVELDLELFKQP